MTFADGIVDGRLAILIRLVHIHVVLAAQVLDRLGVPLPGDIEQRRLLQGVFTFWVNSKIDEHFDHSEGELFVWNDAGRENWGLAEIFGLIDEISDVNVRLLHELGDAIDIASFDLLEKGTVQRVHDTASARVGEVARLGGHSHGRVRGALACDGLRGSHSCLLIDS